MGMATGDGDGEAMLHTQSDAAPPHNPGSCKVEALVGVPMPSTALGGSVLCCSWHLFEHSNLLRIHIVLRVGSCPCMSCGCVDQASLCKLWTI